MHHPIPAQGKWLRRIVQGYFNYYAVPTNAKALDAFRHHITDLWRRTLRRRSQKDGFTWARMTKLADDWLPKPTILHPWPSDRFAVTHPRWKKAARTALCGGRAMKRTSLPLQREVITLLSGAAICPSLVHAQDGRIGDPKRSVFYQ